MLRRQSRSAAQVQTDFPGEAREQSIGQLKARPPPGRSKSSTIETSCSKRNDLRIEGASVVTRYMIAPRVKAAAAGQASVWIVEDNQVAQWIVHALLAWNHYKVVSAHSGPEAIRAIESDSFDLILMDLQMPGINGLDAACCLRRLENSKNTAIVAFTANSTAQYRDLCCRAGFQGFLAKLVNVSDLLATVDYLCGTAAITAHCIQPLQFLDPYQLPNLQISRLV